MFCWMYSNFPFQHSPHYCHYRGWWNLMNRNLLLPSLFFSNMLKCTWFSIICGSSLLHLFRDIGGCIFFCIFVLSSSGCVSISSFPFKCDPFHQCGYELNCFGVFVSAAYIFWNIEMYLVQLFRNDALNMNLCFTLVCIQYW